MTLNMASSRPFGSRPSFSRIASSSTSVEAQGPVERDRRRRRGHRGTVRRGRGRRPRARDRARRSPTPPALTTSERMIPRPSSLPRIASTAVSGCGISPATLPAALRTPAIPRSDPLGLPGSSGPGDRAVGVRVAPQDAAVALQLVERRLVRVVAALAVGDGHPERAPLADLARERRVEVLRAAASPRGRRSAGRGCAAARPGTSRASARTWKPLQIPRTGPPRSAKSATARMTGLNRAMTPARR